MPLIQKGSLRAYQLQNMQDEPIVHGFFTRVGGSSCAPFDSLNMGHTVGDEPIAVEANHQALYHALGVSREQVVSAHQVHGDHVACVSDDDRGMVMAATDGLISDSPGIALLMRFADCVPLMFYDPRQKAIGLAHGGWRGTVLGIATKTALLMMSTFGCHAEELRVGIGPSIGPCCYQVGPDVIQAVRETMPDCDDLFSKHTVDGRANLDLWRLNARQLIAMGVEQIEMAELCTACHTDLYYSHRAERGRTGRFAAVIGLREG